MEVEDAHIAGLVGVGYARPRLTGTTLLMPPWNLQKHGSQTAVTRLDDKRDWYYAVGGEIDWQLLTLESSRLPFVPVHGRYRALWLVREKHALAG